ncbi:MAG: FISUMP domain-containing protein [Bacteroidota bacterium]|nr:FISUMP domain-containing protein [Bacteroidota bacterium]
MKLTTTTMQFKKLLIYITFFTTIQCYSQFNNGPNGYVSSNGVSKIRSTSVIISGSFRMQDAINAIQKEIGQSIGNKFQVFAGIRALAYTNSLGGKKIGYLNRDVQTDTISIDSTNIGTTGKLINFDMTVSNLLPDKNFYASIRVTVIVLGSQIYSKTVPPNQINFLINKTTTVNFKTLLTDPTDINNNYITSSDQTICPEGSPLFYQANTINASMPAGGNGNYATTWQKSTDNNVTWYNCENGNNLLSYTPTKIFDNNTSYTMVSYRRIISSAELGDTSNSISITYLPKGYVPVLTIVQEKLIPGALALSLKVDNLISNYKVSWKDSVIKTSSSTLSPEFQNELIIPYQGGPPHIYQAIVNYDSSCPTFKSKNIYVSPPDGDGNPYAAVKIEKQLWSINNLRATCFNDHVPIKVVSNNGNFADYSWYNNDSIGNFIRYGALYNVTVINNGKGKNVCPSGWQPADVMDWYKLFDAIGGRSVAAPLLKSSEGWIEQDYQSNAYNFNALPSGEKYGLNQFQGSSYFSTWWGIVADQDVLYPHNQSSYFEVIGPDDSIYFVVPDAQNSISKSQRSIRCIKYEE